MLLVQHVLWHTQQTHTHACTSPPCCHLLFLFCCFFRSSSCPDRQKETWGPCNVIQPPPMNTHTRTEVQHTKGVQNPFFFCSFLLKNTSWLNNVFGHKGPDLQRLLVKAAKLLALAGQLCVFAWWLTKSTPYHLTSLSFVKLHRSNVSLLRIQMSQPPSRL